MTSPVHRGTPLTALVVFSHSRMLAEGVVELARGMAPTVALYAVGGTVDGRLGTDADELTRVVDELLDQGHEVLICPDLGSAVMSAEFVVDMLDDPRVGAVDLPLVRGTMAAACSAQRGDDMRTCAQAGAQASQFVAGSNPVSMSVSDDHELSCLYDVTRATVNSVPVDTVDLTRSATTPSGSDMNVEHTSSGGEGKVSVHLHALQAPAQLPIPEAHPLRRIVDVADPDGIHARVAAAITYAVHRYDACVEINGASARNIFDLMGLGVSCGEGVTIVSYGREAKDALEAVCEILLATSHETTSHERA
ncbi:dihydroxyacetone kinase phosphoryl donor subunit DhaM [Actinomyces vulturis]|uniref:dihydroxyacetone kinase phosphoryl donor subunit DhaM n=1 Tax=Actinomyces vulturis TaxID=1857645 RepID=UPI0008306A9F|nr:dihydroxyacetone kinase phosphoryl donor subunit DhaM [Actinomyces vulturis]